MPVVIAAAAGGIATITLNQPAARNALDTELVRSLAAALRSAERDAGVRVLILTGAGPAFCAGLDLRELSDPAGRLVKAVRAAINPWALIRRSRKPVIAAVNGPAVTGGLELALSCDLLVASERASFADTHTRVGSLPGQGMSVLLPQAVGLRKAKELAFTGRFVAAKEALEIGLVNAVVPHARLLPTARSLAAEIMRSEQDVLEVTKRLYDASAAGTAADAMKRESAEFNRWRLQAPQGVHVRRLIERGSRQVRRDGRN